MNLQLTGSIPVPQPTIDDTNMENYLSTLLKTVKEGRLLYHVERGVIMVLSKVGGIYTIQPLGVDENKRTA